MMMRSEVGELGKFATKKPKKTQKKFGLPLVSFWLGLEQASFTSELFKI
jgi:hypothetical protein